MKVAFIRHARPIDPTNFTGDDRHRPLSRPGKKAFNYQLATWKRLQISFDHVVTSPYLRTVQTANLIRKRCLVKTAPVICDAIQLSAHLPAFFDQLSTYDYSSIGVVTHEPVIHDLLQHYFPYYCPSITITPGTMIQLTIGPTIMINSVIQL